MKHRGLEIVDNRSGTSPLCEVVDVLYDLSLGKEFIDILASRHCSVKIKYKKAVGIHDVRTSSMDRDMLTALSLHLSDALGSWNAKTGPHKTPLTSLTEAIVAAKQSSSVTGIDIATLAGKGGHGLTWTYPSTTGHLTLAGIFIGILAGSLDLYAASGMFSVPATRRQQLCLCLGIDLQRGLRDHLECGPGSDATITFDESFAASHLGSHVATSSNKVKAAVVLVHEMAHAYFALIGAGLYSAGGNLEDVYVIGLNTRRDPWCENAFRDALSVPKRTAI